MEAGPGFGFLLEVASEQSRPDTLPQSNMEAQRGPFVEDGSLKKEQGPSSLTCQFGGV